MRFCLPVYSTSLMIILLVLFFPGVSFSSPKTYVIEGVIAFPQTGKIHVYLVDEKVFKTPLAGIQTIVIELAPKDLVNQIVSFSFQKVKSGTYGIRCFQDVNGDAKLNKGMFGPSEPWGMSWKDEKPAKWPSFKAIAFEVNADIKNIKIKLE